MINGMNTPRVTVILVSYNSKAVIGDALRSIPKGVSVIVVDNASCDGSPEYIRQNFPNVDVIVNEKNIGFGPANNIAIEKVASPFSLLMNPDTCFTDPLLIEKLLQAGDRHPRAAILAPNILNAEDELETNLPAPMGNRKAMHGLGVFRMEDVQGDTCAFALSGALMLLRMNAFQDMGQFFDPNIFMYFEDDDICKRANQYGFSTILIPSVTVKHLIGKSSPSTIKNESLKLRHKTFSQLYVLAKYGKARASSYKAIRIILRNSVLVLLYILTVRGDKARISFSRLLGGLKYMCFHFSGNL